MRFSLLFLLLLSIAAAQSVGFGVKGGVPFTDLFEARGFIGTEPFRASTQHFTVGPMLDVRLPLGFGLEFDALYKRFGQSGGSVRGGTATKTGASWEFPLLGKYRFGGSWVKPYIEAGVSFDHLAGYLVTFRTLPGPPSDQPEISNAVDFLVSMALGTGNLSPQWENRKPGLRSEPTDRCPQLAHDRLSKSLGRWSGLLLHIHRSITKMVPSGPITLAFPNLTGRFPS